LLSQQNARRIVRELSDVIGQKINIMDEKGIIIASSDSQRVGCYHEGAGRILNLHLKELIVCSDQEYEGCKEGVNYPITVQNQIIGVVGITGNYREAVKYGQIIQKLVGILLREISIKEQKVLDEKIRNRYVEEWMNLDGKQINQAFVERGKAMEIDITLPRRLIAFAIAEDDGVITVSGMKTAEKALDKLKEVIKIQEKSSIYLQSASRLICAVSERTDEQMERLARQMKSYIEKDRAIRLAVGIDDKSYDYLCIGTAEKNAEKALQVSLRNPRKEICFYQDIGMELFSDEISDGSKVEYVRRIFKDYTREEISDAMILLRVFYECGGSLNKASEQLHMHKNTLQYKLLKIKEKTGYDPRSLQESSLFYIASFFYNEIRNLL
jgi:carbohydrate diacid regulator